MFWDSLKALSTSTSRCDFITLSEKLGRNKYYLSQVISSLGYDPSDSTARDLLGLLVREGVDSNDMSIQWTEQFLETRGLEFLDFDFIYKELTLTTRIRSLKTTLIPSQIKIAKQIIWGMTGGRNWMTGEIMSIDDVWLHHICHDSQGFTLYGGIYDSLGGHNFAAITKNQNEKDVEINRIERQKWEDRFIYMWQCFKKGDFRAATEHWKDVNPQNQLDFLREIRSRRYLDYWISKL